MFNFYSDKQAQKGKFQNFCNQYRILLEGVEFRSIDLSLYGFRDSESEMARKRSFVTFTDLTKLKIVGARGVETILKYPDFSSEVRYAAIPAPWADVVMKCEYEICSLIIENKNIGQALRQEDTTFNICYLIKSADGLLYKVYQSSFFIFSADGKPCGRIDYCIIDRDTHDPVVIAEIVKPGSGDVLFSASEIFSNIHNEIINSLGLTKREIEICKYLLIGYSTEGIATTLIRINHGKRNVNRDEQQVKTGTILKHTSNITQKGKELFPHCNIKDANDVAFLLFRHGIITREKDRILFLTRRD